MKDSHSFDSVRVFFGSSLLIILFTAVCFSGFRASASENKVQTISVGLKSQNTAAVNLLPGRELATLYESADSSSYQLKAGQNRPLALVSADFDADGFPDLISGYSSPDGSGVLTFRKGNPEAFAPQSDESLALLKEGRFPDSFLKNAESFSVSAAPDFLVSGDFDRDGNLDIITATRGGDKVYLFSGAGRDGGFSAPQEISLSGRVTAMTAGEIDASDNRADLLVGVEGDSGASLLVFENAETGVFGSPASYRLSSAATSLELGKLDDDAFSDAAILTGDGVYILHGQNRKAEKESDKNVAARLEKINLPFVPQALTTGDFIFDRAGKTEMALLAEDGSVQIARRGELDERPFSVEEAQANRRQAFETQTRGSIETKLKNRQIGMSEDWTVDGNVSVADSAVQRSGAAPILMKANLSGQNTDDILLLNSETKEIKVLSAPAADKTDDKNSFDAKQRAVYSLEAANEPVAVLPMKLNIFARPGLVILQNERLEPSVVTAAAVLTLTVDRFDDTNAAAAQACTAAANDCSLRGAISLANATAGADTIIVPAGTYTLSLANAGANEDNNATGDLDIKDSLTITGAGQAATIIQGGTTATNGIDKVFASNPICASVVNTSFSGLTVRYGRNTQPNGAADFSFTGGGLDWCNPGAGGTLTITNSTFDSNSATTGPGGGIDLDTSSTTSGSVTLTGVTISNNKSSNPSAGGITVPANGGGLAALAGPYNVTITNSTVSGNTAQTNSGGGLYFEHISTANSVFQLSGVTVSNNSAFSAGGGIDFVGSTNGAVSFSLNQSSTVSGNISGTGAGGVAQGGGIFVQPFTGSATINKTTIVNNVLSSTATTNRGGAGIAAGQGNTTVSYCRIVGNTGTTTLGTGLNKDLNPGTANAAENWWGCSTGPSAAPCDTAVLTPGSTGSLNYTPWIVLRHTASPSTIVVGQSTTLTASFLTDSAGNALSLSNITVLLGLPITFNNPVRGTISNAQTTIQSSGTATATFTGTSVGAGSADAIVDNDVAAAGRTNRATLTINQSGTTTTLATSGSPTVFGQSVTFTATVSVNSPGAGTPTGTVTFKDNGVNIGSCAAQTVTTGTATCTISTLSVGSHPITAVYNGDANFSTSTVSNTVTQVVNKANTTAAITNDTPDPSVVGQNYTVNATVAVNSPGAGTPTGTITVTDGTNNCTITLPATSCSLPSISPGAKTLTATYNGDSNFIASPASSGAAHTVNKADTTATITNDTPDPSVVGQAYAVTASAAVNSPGAGVPTGTITVSDGSQTCTITLPATSCNLTSTTAGAKTLTATYNGDANFNASPLSAGVAHTVNKAGTTTTINSNTPNPSNQNTAVTVTFSVAVNSPGAGTPTGTVTVSDGVNSCMASVAAGSCMITLTTSGTRTLTATYGSDTNFNGSASAGVSQTVLAPTAANVEVGGRVTTSTGRGLNKALVTITDQTGNSRTATTNPFGYFRFTDVQAGETYIISVSAKRYHFAPQVLNVTEDLTDLNFMAQP